MSITNVSGVYASGIHCGIKSSGALDLAFIYVPNCVGSGVVLSKNNIVSYTLVHNKTLNHPIKLIIVNSGNANCLTGTLGKKHVLQTVKAAAQQFHCREGDVAVASTGIIGVSLPIDRVLAGIRTFDPYDQQASNCSRAILTTDLTRKEVTRSLMIDGKPITIAAITKGSGMIAPNMATTLGFIVTDAAMNSAQCSTVLRKAMDESYNMLSVDTDCSTNDMVSLQSSGAAHVDWTESSMQTFQSALTGVCQELAKKIAMDGEGAKHLIQVDVLGATKIEHARRVAKQVVNSPLVKTAVAGEDPNWGRIAMALGKDDTVPIQLHDVSIAVNGTAIFSNGQPENLDRQSLKSVMAHKEVLIQVTIGSGNCVATAWGCDLTHGYIDINTAYN